MPIPSRVARVAREPLFHFAALGAMIFAAHAALARTEKQGRIVVSAAFVEGLRREHAARTGRPPTKEEERSLVDQFIDEEVLVREARALGLDRGDPIVRRRLAQKMSFIAEESAAREPSDDDLRAYLLAHEARYREPPRLSFRHVFMSRDRRGDATHADATRMLGDLSRGAIAPEIAGDPFLRGAAFTRQTPAEIEGAFGPEFAARLLSEKPRAWFGPVRSAYGEHVIEIVDRVEGKLSDLASVRARVRSDLLDERRDKAAREARVRLRSRYEIEIEAPRATVAEAR